MAFPDLKELLPEILDIAQSASDEILGIYQTAFSVAHKADKTPLTEADMSSHHLICDGLRTLTPDIPVLSEESADIDFNIRRDWEYYWLIDPLDGTREFIKQNGEFTVNIALIHQHHPVLGVITVPVSGKSYWASQGNGAFVDDPDTSTRVIRTRKTDSRCFRVAGSRSHGSKQLKDFIAGLGEYELLSIGSSLKFCLVAEGLVDIYPRFGPTSEWDTAAAQCIVEEAGGRVLDIDFNRLSYNTKPEFLNPHFIAIGDPVFQWVPYFQ